jgi:hypothetical protein
MLDWEYSVYPCAMWDLRSITLPICLCFFGVFDFPFVPFSVLFRVGFIASLFIVIDHKEGFPI